MRTIKILAGVIMIWNLYTNLFVSTFIVLQANIFGIGLQVDVLPFVFFILTLILCIKVIKLK